MEEMKKKLMEAVRACGEKSENAVTALEAMQYSQAALNLTNALACVKNME